MIIRETVVFRIGRTSHNTIVRTKMVQELCDKKMFDDVPIVYNKDCAVDELIDYKEQQDKLVAIGRVIGSAKVYGRKVLADIEINDEFVSLWKGSYDNWVASGHLNEKKEVIIDKLLAIEIN